MPKLTETQKLQRALTRCKNQLEKSSHGTENSLSKLTVKELQDMLRKKGQTYSGLRKAELVEKLLGVKKSPKKSSSPKKKIYDAKISFSKVEGADAEDISSWLSDLADEVIYLDGVKILDYNWKGKVLRMKVEFNSSFTLARIKKYFQNVADPDPYGENPISEDDETVTVEGELVSYRRAE